MRLEAFCCLDNDLNTSLLVEEAVFFRSKRQTWTTSPTDESPAADMLLGAHSRPNLLRNWVATRWSCIHGTTEVL